MSPFDPNRPPEERIQLAMVEGPDLEARGRFGGVSRIVRRLVGRAVKYERDFNLQIDVALLDRMHEIVQTALATDQIKRLWAEQGAKVEPESRTDFARFVDQEIQRWQRIAKAAEIDMD